MFALHNIIILRIITHIWLLDFSLIALQELKDKRLLLVECQAKNATYHENTSAPIIKTNIVQREAKACVACRVLSEI